MEWMISIDHVVGFDVSIAVMFFILTAFSIAQARKTKRMYLYHLAGLSLALGVIRILEPILLFDLQVVRTGAVRFVFIFLIFMLPYLVLVTVHSLVREPAAVRRGQRWVVLGYMLGACAGAVLGALAMSSRDLFANIYVWSAVPVIASLLISIYLLKGALQRTVKERKAGRTLLAFLLVNIIGLAITQSLFFMVSDRAYHMAESCVFALDGYLLFYLVIFVNPYETLQQRYDRVRRDFDDLMKSAGDGISMLDMDGKVVSANLSLKTMLRMDDELIEDRMFHELVPARSSRLVTVSIGIAKRGAIAKEVRHGLLRYPGRGDIEGPTVVSTFSPIMSSFGEVEGVLVMTRDLTPFVDLETERILRRRSEAQTHLQKVLTSVIPFLLLGVDPVTRRVYLNLVLNKIEKDLSMRDEDNSNRGLAGHMCDIMNNLGGEFKWKPDSLGRDDVKDMTFYGLDCPWGTDAKKNPLLCHLCKGIFTRIVCNCNCNAKVELTKTIANGDHRCIVKVVCLDNGLDNEEGDEGHGADRTRADTEKARGAEGETMTPEEGQEDVGPTMGQVPGVMR